MMEYKFEMILLFSLLCMASCQPASTLSPPVIEEARIDTLAIPSPSMNKTIPALAIVPGSYFENEAKEFPVVYLLHGAFGEYLNWYKGVPELVDYANEYEQIIVCPDGGYTSWYFDSPIDPDFQYETHIIEEVVPFIDSNYHTLDEAAYRAITGLSMGGHGALYLAARHPEVFGAAGSMSGGVDFRPFPEKWDIKERLGQLQTFPKRWETNTVVTYDTVFAKNGQDLIIDCGVEDFFFEVNEQLHDRLMNLGVEHDYIIRPGEHNWEYWRNAVEYQLLFFSKFFLCTDSD